MMSGGEIDPLKNQREPKKYNSFFFFQSEGAWSKGGKGLVSPCRGAGKPAAPSEAKPASSPAAPRQEPPEPAKDPRQEFPVKTSGRHPAASPQKSGGELFGLCGLNPIFASSMV